jgi:hypothetical protein
MSHGSRVWPRSALIRSGRDDDIPVRRHLPCDQTTQRRAKPTFGWIDLASQIETTINGKLLDVGGSQFQKFETTISCTDFRPPLLELLTPGLAVEVDCVAELGYPSSGAATRAVVSGSLRTEGSFKFYRPQLRCWVMTPANSREEYTTTNNWSIVLREDGH